MSDYFRNYVFKSGRTCAAANIYLEDIFGSADITRTLLYQGTMWTFVILVSPDTYQVHLKFILFVKITLLIKS